MKIDINMLDDQDVSTAPQFLGWSSGGPSLTALGKARRVPVLDASPTDETNEHHQQFGSPCQQQNGGSPAIPVLVEVETNAPPAAAITKPTKTVTIAPMPKQVANLRKSSFSGHTSLSSPKTPANSVMNRTHQEAPGTIEYGATTAKKKKKQWVVEYQQEEGFAGGSKGGRRTSTTSSTVNFGSLNRQEIALRAWMNAKTGSTFIAGDNGLTSRRLVARVRGVLWNIYAKDVTVKETMLKVESRIKAKQIRIQEEECLKYMDSQSQLIVALHSYHPFWLKLAAEIVVGKSITKVLNKEPTAAVNKFASARGGPFKSSSPELDKFINCYFLHDISLARKHAGPMKSAAYWKELGELLFKRVLLLILLLDRCAQLPKLPSGAPLLFKRSGSFKASLDVVQASVGFLMKEIEPQRHLARLGYKVGYVQQPELEIDFAARNLAVDLRDGVKLCRLAEALCGRYGLPEGCRIAAQRRPDRLYNVKLALDILSNAGLETKALPPTALQVAEVVDGDRQGTLNLLWQLVLHYEIPELVSPNALGLELNILTRGNPSIPCSRTAGAADSKIMLLQWAKAISSRYGLEAVDFGQSFADGRVFCALIHHYMGDLFIPQHLLQASPPLTDSEAHTSFTRRNFDTVITATTRLGGIPPVVDANEFLAVGGPDERAVSLYLAFLYQRLMEVSKEQRAVVVLQRAWRQRETRRPGVALSHLKRWIAAAECIQRAARVWLLRRGVAESHLVRGRMLAGIVKVQAHWRGRQIREEYLELKAAAVTFQSVYRGKLARRKVFDSTVAPQILEAALERRHEIVCSHYDRIILLTAVRLQALRRGIVQRQRFLEIRAASVKIQAAVRGYQTRNVYIIQKQAATVIQQSWRGYSVRKQVALEHQAATRLQTAWSQHLAVCKQIETQNAAALIIQTAWRGHTARQDFLHQKSAAAVIQKTFRGHRQRAAFLQQRHAALLIQRNVRGMLARQEAAHLRRATVNIQSAILAFAYRRRQHAVRDMKRQMVELAATMKQYSIRTVAATRIQAGYRGHIARKQYAEVVAAREAVLAAQQAKEHAARAVIAFWVPTFKARMSFLRAKKAAVVVQAQWRKQLARRTAAAIVIQASTRRYLAEKRYQEMKAASLVLQANWRGYRVRATHPQHKKLAHLRRNLKIAAQEARLAPERTLGGRTAGALHQLSRAAGVGRGLPSKALEELAKCTSLCQGCSRMVSAEPKAISLLVKTIAGAGRDKSHLMSARYALTVLAAMCESYKHGACTVFESFKKDEVQVIADMLQKNRDNEDLFNAIVCFLHRLVSDPTRAKALGREPGLVPKLEGVARILQHKHGAAGIYLEKLEATKGSDASARQATKTFVTVSNQLAVLSSVLAALGATRDSIAGGVGTHTVKGKNTIVRSVLQELTNKQGLKLAGSE